MFGDTNRENNSHQVFQPALTGAQHWSLNCRAEWQRPEKYCYDSITISQNSATAHKRRKGSGDIIWKFYVNVFEFVLNEY